MGLRAPVRHSVPCQWVDPDGTPCPDGESDMIWGTPGVSDLGAACKLHANAMLAMYCAAQEQGLVERGMATRIPKELWG